MALIKTSSVVADISGNLGAVNFATTKNGIIARRTRPAKKSATEKQLRVRADFALVRQQWNALTDTVRLNWNTLASNLQRTDRLGVVRSISGLQLFLQTNLRRQAFLPGSTPIVLPDLPRTEQIAGFRIETPGGGDIDLNWDTPTSNPVGIIYVYAARSFSTAPSRFFTTHLLIDTIGVFILPIDYTVQIESVLGTLHDGELFSVKLLFQSQNLLESTAVTAQTHAVV